jgi:3',5'-cyclic-AMP phosphodiesterase
MSGVARTLRTALCCAGITGATACYGPPEDRALRDLEVGRASASELEIEVEDGLAAVHDLTEEGATLWANAPVLTIRFRAGEPLPGFRLRIDNAMPGARFEAPAGVPITPIFTETPTRAETLIDLPRGDTRVRLAEPDAESPAPWRFALLSDVQEAIGRVQDLFIAISQEPVRFTLGAGDLTERGTVSQLRLFQRKLEFLEVPYYATLGNHELGASPPPFHDLFGRGSSHFAYRGVAFSLLDSASATLDPLVYGWLDGWMAESRDRLHVVAMHIPPVDPIGLRNGSFASRNEAMKLLGRMARGGVDLTLYGHVHTYMSFQNAGIEAHISGGGGAIPERFDGVGRHFLVVDVDPERGVTGRRVVDLGD